MQRAYLTGQTKVKTKFCHGVHIWCATSASTECRYPFRRCWILGARANFDACTFKCPFKHTSTHTCHWISTRWQDKDQRDARVRVGITLSQVKWRWLNVTMTKLLLDKAHYHGNNLQRKQKPMAKEKVFSKTMDIAYGWSGKRTNVSGPKMKSEFCFPSKQEQTEKRQRVQVQVMLLNKWMHENHLIRSKTSDDHHLLKVRHFLIERRWQLCFVRLLVVIPFLPFVNVCLEVISAGGRREKGSATVQRRRIFARHAEHGDKEAQWPIGYGVGLRIKRSSVRIRPWPLRWVLGQGSLLPLSQGEAFTLASISYLAILVKYILAKKKKFSDHFFPLSFFWQPSEMK